VKLKKFTMVMFQVSPRVLRISPVSYQSTKALHSVNVRRWKICPLQATVPQRHAVEPPHELKQNYESSLSSLDHIHLPQFDEL
jgi:hypothetical protein